MPNLVQENCICDCRVSSTKQQAGGGLGDQENIVDNLVKRRGWNNLKTFSKVYSGRAEERADFEEILDFIKEKKRLGIQIHHYVIKSIDRFTRDGAVTYSEMQDRLTLLGVQIVDAWGIIQPAQNTLEHLGFEYKWSIRSPTATAQLMEAQRAKDEVTDILTRMVGAEIRLVQQGYKVRAPNDGFLNDHILVDGKNRVIEIPDPKRAHFFQTMFELRAKGVDDREIVARVNAMGYKTKPRNIWDKKKSKVIGRSAEKPLTVKQLQRLIQRPIYAGIKVEKWTNNKPIRAQYDGLVSVERFNEANRGNTYLKVASDGSIQLLYNHSPFGRVKAKRKRLNPDFPFAFLPCELCEKKKPVMGSAPRSKSGKHSPRYHCGNTPARPHAYYSIPREEFEKNVKDYISELRFDAAFLEGFELVLNDTYRTREKEIIVQSSIISHNVGDLKAQQASVLDTIATTQSPVVRTKLEEKYDDLERQIQEAQSKRGEIEITEGDIKSFVRYVKAVMEHPSEILLDTSDMRAQRALFGLVFQELPTYQEILNGTPKLSFVFKLSEEYTNRKSQLVTLRGIEPRFKA